MVRRRCVGRTDLEEACIIVSRGATWPSRTTADLILMVRCTAEPRVARRPVPQGQHCTIPEYHTAIRPYGHSMCWLRIGVSTPRRIYLYLDYLQFSPTSVVVLVTKPVIWPDHDDTGWEIVSNILECELLMMIGPTQACLRRWAKCFGLNYFGPLQFTFVTYNQMKE